MLRDLLIPVTNETIVISIIKQGWGGGRGEYSSIRGLVIAKDWRQAMKRGCFLYRVATTDSDANVHGYIDSCFKCHKRRKPLSLTFLFSILAFPGVVQKRDLIIALIGVLSLLSCRGTAYASSLRSSFSLFYTLACSTLHFINESTVFHIKFFIS